MVMSCLVEPLVQPLVSSVVGGRGRRTGSVRSRLAASAMMMSAVMALGTPSPLDAAETRDAAPTVERNAHKPPAPVPLRDVPRVFGGVKAIFDLKGLPRVAKPWLAPRFEWDAIWASRLRHACDLMTDPGPVLGRARRRSRVEGAWPPTFLRFGSGVHLAGASGPLAA